MWDTMDQNEIRELATLVYGALKEDDLLYWYVTTEWNQKLKRNYLSQIIDKIKDNEFYNKTVLGKTKEEVLERSFESTESKLSSMPNGMSASTEDVPMKLR